MRLKNNLDSRFPTQFKRWLAGEFEQAAALNEKKERFGNRHEKNLLQSRLQEKAAKRIDEEKQLRVQNILYRWTSFLMTFAIIGTMLWNIHYLPNFAEADQPMNNEVSERYIEKGMEETGGCQCCHGYDPGLQGI